MARVLIADDSAAFRALAARVIEQHGHQVAGEAADGTETLRLAAALAPDGVLLDVHLGADDGFAVRRALGALPRPPQVILVSTDPDTGALPKDRLAAAGWLDALLQ
jgi:chemotaxis response regulator CheB